MDLISNISKNDLVKGLPKIGFQKDKICEVYQFRKQIKTSLKNKNYISTSKPLELLHIDLFGAELGPGPTWIRATLNEDVVSLVIPNNLI